MGLTSKSTSLSQHRALLAQELILRRLKGVQCTSLLHWNHRSTNLHFARRKKREPLGVSPRSIFRENEGKTGVDLSRKPLVYSPFFEAETFHFSPVQVYELFVTFLPALSKLRVVTLLNRPKPSPLHPQTLSPPSPRPNEWLASLPRRGLGRVWRVALSLVIVKKPVNSNMFDFVSTRTL